METYGHGDLVERTLINFLEYLQVVRDALVMEIISIISLQTQSKHLDKKDNL